MSEYFRTSSKKGRGRAQRSIDLIEAMTDIAAELEPITGRGIGYKLFTLKLIDSMGTNDMAGVYRLLREAREEGIIPWEWVVDESRDIERVSTWSNPAEYAECVARSYRRDFWDQQPKRVEAWSEKGTVRGVIQPVLDHFAIGFRVLDGFSSATAIHEACRNDDGRELVVLYIGDYDPSGLFMSEVDLPNRLARYDGDQVTLKRIALTKNQVPPLPSFPAKDKKRDPRFRWFVENYGAQCWELDAMDPRTLRRIVEQKIRKEIEPIAWQRCEVVNGAEQESLKTILEKWGEP